MSAHTCHAIGCTVVVPPKLFMCRAHWFMVPPLLRAALQTAYKPGQERRFDPSDAYLAAARAARQAVREIEQADLRGGAS